MPMINPYAYAASQMLANVRVSGAARPQPPRIAYHTNGTSIAIGTMLRISTGWKRPVLKSYKRRISGMNPHARRVRIA